MARILVAEDEAEIGEIVRRALEYKGHDVTVVGNGSAAVEALGRDSYDLLLTDIVMPLMDGIALALKVDRDYLDIPILMMTGYAAQKERAHNLDDLIHGVLMKPFTIADMAERVENALT